MKGETMRLQPCARLPGIVSLVCGKVPAILAAVAFLPLACTAPETHGPGEANVPAAAPLDGPSLVVRRLAGTVDLVGHKVTLRSALLEMARQRPDLNLSLDPDLAQDAALEAVVGDLDLRRIPVEEALRLVLAPCREGVFRVEPQRVLVTTRAKVLADLVTAGHPIGDLQQQLMADPYFETAAVQANAGARSMAVWQFVLASFVAEYVNSETDPCVADWNTESPGNPGGKHSFGGSAAEMTCRDGVLWVKQTREGQAHVAALLTRLRAALENGRLPANEATAEVARANDAEPEETLAVRQLLATRIDVDFKATPFPDALAAILAKAPGLQSMPDPEIAAAGLDLGDRLITLRGRQVTLQSVLHRLLQPSLGYDVRPGYLWITLRDRLAAKLLLASHDVAGLVAPMSVTRTLPDGRKVREPVLVGALDWRDLITLVRRRVNCVLDPNVAAWCEDGGPAAIQGYDNTLIVAQTRPGHEQVAALLRKLLEERVAAARESLEQAQDPRPQFRPPTFKPPEDEATPEDKAVLAQLAQRVNFQFADKPLSEVLERIREAAPDLSLVVSDDVAAAGIDLVGCKVTLNAGNAPLRTVLDQALGNALVWRIKEGWLEIIPRESDPTPLLPTATYPVAGLVAAQPRRPGDAKKMAVDELIAFLRQAVNSDSDKDVAAWEEDGGSAFILYANGMLILSQTPHGHQQVCDRLNACLLRPAGGKEPPRNR
jgi:hypothetical protein